jgi:hypothetical protein
VFNLCSYVPLLIPKRIQGKKPKGARNFHAHFEAFSVFNKKVRNTSNKKKMKENMQMQVDKVHRALKEIF